MNRLAIHPGFAYELVHRAANGAVISRERVHNRVPLQGLDYIAGVAFAETAKIPNWFVMVFEGNYTPSPEGTETAQNIASLAAESIAYTGQRKPWVHGGVSGGSIDNTASPAVFTFTTGKTIYGCGLISTATKGGTAGVLASLVRFPTAKVVAANETLDVLAGPSAFPFTE